MKIKTIYDCYAYFNITVESNNTYAKYANGAIRIHYPGSFYRYPAEKKNISGYTGLTAVIMVNG